VQRAEDLHDLRVELGAGTAFDDVENQVLFHLTGQTSVPGGQGSLPGQSRIGVRARLSSTSFLGIAFTVIFQTHASAAARGVCRWQWLGL
jgi:hypothetical protein